MHPDRNLLEERIVELESRLVFQEQTLEELHEVLYRQQTMIDELTGELNRLQRRLREFLPDPETDSCHG